jgi:hypothetical protein
MNRTIRCTIARCLPLVCMIASIAHAEQWTAPTPEELKMTSQPEVPGAAAVYLYREETTDDDLHMWSVYVRVKVLNEKGKEYANVELAKYGAYEWKGYTVTEVAGRTIHSDGTVIPFTGAPYEKLIEKTNEHEVNAKVFTLPDVEVGSILEYRFKLRYDDHSYISPDWYVQTTLFTRKAKYTWRPTSKNLTSRGGDGGGTSGGIAWTKILPDGADFKETRLPSVGYELGQLLLELNIANVPPVPDEEFMLPVASLSYRVLFYYSFNVTQYDFWKNEGSIWSKEHDKFIGPGPKVGVAVKELTSSSDTDEQKLRKLYSAVMQLDNTMFSRSHSAAEDKSNGLGAARNTDDIWDRKRGSADEIVELLLPWRGLRG